MTSRSIRAQEHEEVGKSIQCRAVIRCWTAVFLHFPVLLDVLAVTSNNIHKWNKLVGLEPCCEHNNVGGNKPLVCLEAICGDSFSFRIC